LLAIISSKGQHSLKSSIVFLRSRNACHSFKAFGSLRILGTKIVKLNFPYHNILLRLVLEVRYRLEQIWLTKAHESRYNLPVLIF
jgi:hypothetical protein